MELEQTLQDIFKTLINKSDIFKYLDNLNIIEQYIVYKQETEYRTEIDIYDIYGKLIIYLFIDKNNKITTFYNKLTKNGLYEMIYYDKIDYYYDNKYYKSYIDNNINNIIKKNTKLILEDKISEKLYNFIINNNKICLIKNKEIQNLFDYF